MSDQKPMEIGMCSLDGCERPTFNKDVCELHFEPPSQVKLEASGVGTGKVMVGGVDMSNVTRRVEVDVDPNNRGTAVRLHLKFGAVAAALADADVRVDAATSAALIDLGWTPPGAPAIRFISEDAGKVAEFVLTWHPIVAPDDGMVLVDGDPVEIPLGEPWLLPGTDVAVGEFRLSTREVPDGEVPDDLDPAVVVDLLSLVGVTVSQKQAEAWTDGQRQQAARWAGAAHLSASDNDWVRVPPRPAFLDEVSGG